MSYEKHTNKELLSECRNCIGDLLNEIAILTKQERPQVIALRDEIGKRTKGITFITDDASAQEVKEPEMRVCEFCGVKHLKVDNPKTWPTFTGHTHGE